MKVSDLVIKNPFEQVVKCIFTGGNFQNGVGKFFLRIVQLNFIERKKNKHNMSANPFVSVHKCMIFDQTVSEPSAFCCIDGNASFVSND